MNHEKLISALTFDEKGLIPVVVQDYVTHEVLTLAYMSRESLGVTLAEGRTCFYSRGRRRLWRKGETSGHVQEVVSLTADCDGDALVAQVKKAGPACHTGRESCFYNGLYENEDVRPFSLFTLMELLADRRAHPKEGSYTSYLFEKGRDKILKKVGEECAEVLIGGAKGDRAETAYELADLAYHAMALMAEMGISLEDVVRELARRHVIDKKVKQERMK